MSDSGKSPRRVLFIVSEFAPMVSIGRLRVQAFARYLTSYGWEPTVLTFDPRDIWHTDETLREEIPTTLAVERVRWRHPYDMPLRFVRRLRQSRQAQHRYVPPTTVPAAAEARDTVFSGTRRRLTMPLDRLKAGLEKHTLIPDESITGVPGLVRRGIRLHRQRPFDAVVVSMPAYATWLAGLAVKRVCGIPLIVDYRDLWQGDVLRQWVPRWRQRAEAALERWALAGTDGVVTVSSRYTQRVRELDPQPHRRVYETIYSGFDPRCLPDENEPSRNKAATDPIELLYVGRLFKNRRADGLIEALGRLHTAGRLPTDNWRLTFLGDVSPEQRKRLDRHVERFGLDCHVRFEGFVPRCEALRRVRRADGLVLIVDEGQASDGVVPGKLFEYLALGRRILSICSDGETDHLLRQAGFSLIARPNKAAEIESIIVKLFTQILAGSLEGVPSDKNRLPFVAERQTRLLANVLHRVTQRCAAAERITKPSVGPALS